MFKRKKELQSLVDSSRKSLAEAEERASKISDELRIARHNNVILITKNRKQTKFIEEVSKLATSNTYDNEKVILEKIRDLARDYQSKKLNLNELI